jgi:phosphomannomutase
VIPPQDTLIAEAAGAAPAPPPGSGGEQVELVDEVALLGAYRRAVFGLLDSTGPRQLRIVYTPLHGVGGAVLPGLLAEDGFEQVSVVAAQAVPDPDFPTLAFPNPEEPGALDLALADAARLGADIVLANDPDADRLAVAVPDPVSGAWRVLSGDELGVLLAEQVLASTTGADRLVATTIVSSTMLSAMAAAAGVAYVETLTGFKWIARAALRRPGSRFVFGYEEALGYEVGDIVSDKDGLSAALVVAELAARAAAEGTSVVGRLDGLAARFGVYANAQWSLRLAGPAAQSEMAEVVDRWRRDPPASLAGLAVVEVVDYAKETGELPATDALLLRLEEGARVVLRPSGTEPKLKAYLEVATRPPPPGRLAEARGRAGRVLQTLREDVAVRCQAS